MLRYRDIYRHMIKGVQEARAEAGVDVLTGGLDSSSNAFARIETTSAVSAVRAAIRSLLRENDEVAG